MIEMNHQTYDQLDVNIKQAAIQGEYAEMRAWEIFFRNARQITDTPLKADIQAGASGLLCCIQDLDILAYNRILGAGIEQPLTREALQQAIGFYRSRAIPRFFLPIAPHILEKMSMYTLHSSGFRSYNRWAILHRTPLNSTFRNRDSSLRVRPANPGEGPLYGLLMIRAFGWPDNLATLLASMVGKPGYRIYFAEKDGIPIAAAALHLHGKTATMVLAGTQEEFRGLGAQKALLARRIEEASKAGCHRIVTQTAEQLPGKPVPSYRNMLKAGFELACYRTNFVFEF